MNEGTMEIEDRVADYTVSRILLISPEQNELLRRNRSRIFVWPTGEGVIDSVIFQASRPIESYIDAVARAIREAGLKDISGSDPDALSAVIEPRMAGGMLQSYLVSTGWLSDDDGRVFDLCIEVQISGEELPEANISTYNAEVLEDAPFGENPLCLVIDTRMLNSHPLVIDEKVEPAPVLSADDQAATTNDDTNGGSGRGRVVDPLLDGRTAANRRATAMARQAQERDQDQGSAANARQRGRPGRVRDPQLDGRLRANRARNETGSASTSR